MTSDWNLTERKQWLSFFHVKQQTRNWTRKQFAVVKAYVAVLKIILLSDSHQMAITAPSPALCFWSKWCLLKEHLAHHSCVQTPVTEKLPFKTLLQQNSSKVVQKTVPGTTVWIDSDLMKLTNLWAYKLTNSTIKEWIN